MTLFSFLLLWPLPPPRPSLLLLRRCRHGLVLLPLKPVMEAGTCASVPLHFRTLEPETDRSAFPPVVTSRSDSFHVYFHPTAAPKPPPPP